MNFLLVSIGVVVGHTLATFSTKKFKSLKYKIGDHCLHLHHWLLALIILGIVTILNVHNGLISGFLWGIIANGLTYKDFYKILYKPKGKTC